MRRRKVSKLRHHIRVGVQCQIDARVTQAVGHYLGGNPLQKEERCRCVPKVVESLPWEPRVREKSLKPMRDRGRVELRTDRGHKHEI